MVEGVDLSLERRVGEEPIMLAEVEFGRVEKIDCMVDGREATKVEGLVFRDGRPCHGVHRAGLRRRSHICVTMLEALHEHKGQTDSI